MLLEPRDDSVAPSGQELGIRVVSRSGAKPTFGPDSCAGVGFPSESVFAFRIS